MNQVYTAHPIAFGPLSLLQIARSLVLAWALALMFTVAPGERPSAPDIRRVAMAAGLCLAVLVSKDILAEGEILLSNIVAYAQIGYWLLIWSLASKCIRSTNDGRTVMKGLLAGGIVTAASVWYGYYAGIGNEIYSRQGVTASSGLFVSGKGIAGILVAAAVLAAYMGSRRGRWAYTAAGLFCIVGAFLTYARAGQIALVASLCWLCVWATVIRADRGSSWARRLVLSAIGFLILGACTIGTADLVRRWSDFQDPQTAGSGRVMIWHAGLEGFRDGSTVEQVFGRGYDGMRALMVRLIGTDIHAHNDVLDMALIGGLFGILLLIFVCAGVLLQLRTCRWQWPEFAAGFAILLVLLCQGFFTGQLFIPDVMAFYLASITAVVACRPPHARSQRKLPAGFVPRYEV